MGIGSRKGVAVQLDQVGPENMCNTIVIPWAVALLTNLIALSLKGPR